MGKDVGYEGYDGQGTDWEAHPDLSMDMFMNSLWSQF